RLRRGPAARGGATEGTVVVPDLGGAAAIVETGAGPLPLPGPAGRSKEAPLDEDAAAGQLVRPRRRRRISLGAGQPTVDVAHRVPALPRVGQDRVGPESPHALAQGPERVAIPSEIPAGLL